MVLLGECSGWNHNGKTSKSVRRWVKRRVLFSLGIPDFIIPIGPVELKDMAYRWTEWLVLTRWTRADLGVWWEVGVSCLRGPQISHCAYLPNYQPSRRLKKLFWTDRPTRWRTDRLMQSRVHVTKKGWTDRPTDTATYRVVSPRLKNRSINWTAFRLAFGWEGVHQTDALGGRILC